MISCEWLFNSYCYGLNLKCPLQNYVLNGWSPVCVLLWTLSSLWQGAGWWEADHHGQAHAALSDPCAVSSCSASGPHQSCFSFPAMMDRNCSDTVSQIKQYNHSSGLQGYPNTSIWGRACPVICCCSKCQMLLTFRSIGAWTYGLVSVQWPLNHILRPSPLLLRVLINLPRLALILWLFASPPEKAL